jgi:hypothetical protein
MKTVIPAFIIEVRLHAGEFSNLHSVGPSGGILSCPGGGVQRLLAWGRNPMVWQGGTQVISPGAGTVLGWLLYTPSWLHPALRAWAPLQSSSAFSSTQLTGL